MEGVTPDDWIHRGRLALRLMMVLPPPPLFGNRRVALALACVTCPRNVCDQLNYSKTPKSCPILSTIFLIHEIRWKMANVLSDALQVGATYLQHGMHWLKCRHPSQLLARLVRPFACHSYLVSLCIYFSFSRCLCWLCGLFLLIFWFLGTAARVLLRRHCCLLLNFYRSHIHTYIHVWLKNEFLCSASRAMNWPANRLHLRFELK